MRRNGGKLFGILFGIPLLLVLPLALVGSSVYRAGSLEVEVVEKCAGGTSIGVKVPAALLPVAARFVPECTLDGVRCELDGDARQAIEIARVALRAIGNGPDGVYVDVQTPSEVVLVEKRDGALRVLVDTPDEAVRVRLPLGAVASTLAAL